MLSRRDFLSKSMFGVSYLGGLHFADGKKPSQGLRYSKPADVTLRIANISHEVAPGRVYQTTAYNGVAPGPLIRLREGFLADIEIVNETGMPEYVHWHGLGVPPEIDGTEEEGSRAVPAHGRLRYSLTPNVAGTRYVHSHAMSGMDLGCGTYSGQFAFVAVEPKRSKGRYDQEVFLATHEWGPSVVWQPEDDDDDLLPGRLPLRRGSWEVSYSIGSINGRALGHGEPVRVKEGRRVLFRLLNASATANVELAFSGHRFLIIALDGNAVPVPQSVETIRLGAAERVDAIVEMNSPGVWVLGAVDDEEREVGRMGIVVEYAGRVGKPKWIAPADTSWDYTKFGSPADENSQPATVPIVIDKVPAGGVAMESWLINGRKYDAASPFVFQNGLAYRLLLANRTDDDHPLHLHRYSFEVCAVNRRKAGGVLKDVAILPAHGSLELEFRPQTPGLALFHCHQQMHMDNGFKTLFRVDS